MALQFSGPLVIVADYALVAVFVLAPTLQTTAALATVRRSRNPIRPALVTGLSYWTGASICLVIEWTWIAKRGGQGDKTVAFVAGVMAWSWAMAAAFTIAIAAVTGTLYAWRIRESSTL
jgi:hypothetical protein